MVCLAAKPVVDGLEKEFEGRAKIVRVNLQSEAGKILGRRLSIDVVPSFVVFDASGDIIATYRGTRGVPLAALRRSLREGYMRKTP